MKKRRPTYAVATELMLEATTEILRRVRRSSRKRFQVSFVLGEEAALEDGEGEEVVDVDVEVKSWRRRERRGVAGAVRKGVLRPGRCKHCAGDLDVRVEVEKAAVAVQRMAPIAVVEAPAERSVVVTIIVDVVQAWFGRVKRWMRVMV